MAYRFVAGAPGNELQPDLATEVPQPTDDGLTYTFKLKPNLKFGPATPNHALVGLAREQAAELKVDHPAGGVPSVDAGIERCQAIPATDADARMGCWADLDKKLMEQVVPWVPLVWDLSTVLTAPSLTRYLFDQASAEISLTQIAVNNRERMS